MSDLATILVDLADAAAAWTPPAAGPAGPAAADEPEIWENEYTDLGNGCLFAQAVSGRVRFSPPLKRWYAWDSRRWAPDATKEAVRLAKRLCHTELHKAINIGDPDAQKRAVKHWLKTQSAGGVSAMLEMASTELPLVVMPAVLDVDPWALNCLNGTLNLRTGQLRPHNAADLMTRLCPVEYHPDADLTEWLRFLNRVVPDPAVQTFLQRAVGYSLTGDTREEVLFFVCGPTNSGKSTFAKAVKKVLGDYAATCDFETFLRRQTTGGPRNDIARLAGARMAVSIEVDEGKRLAEGLVKTLTGGDEVAARFLYEEAVEFTPQFKLWLFANDRPKASDDDSALWRRILLVPFDQTIPESEIDKTLKPRLQDPAIGGLAVLRWAVEGCLGWQRDGLPLPPAVRRATQSYRAENDPLADWLKERCVMVRTAETRFSDLYADYKAYAEAAGCRPISGHKLGVRLSAMQLADGQEGGGQRKRTRHGIGLLSTSSG